MIRALLLIVAALATFALAFVYLRFEHDVESLYGIGPLFDPAREGNVPTWFSSALLLGSAIALAQVGGPDRRRWLVLAAVLCLASLDETANLHELLSAQARRRLFQPGFGQLWVLFLGPVAVAFLAAYAGFIRRQDRVVRRGFALGAALFVGGALGVELVEIALERRQAGALTVALTMVVQEVMELSGAVVLLGASMAQLASDRVARQA